ncbi:hypothetical protein DID76_02565 [Candidatus Marinamargulisbacteria bacterium SCGC AG-414-C22]|nr:hypothetical protein DID76_02565 [Candidatus Marinamargulisbacteria bacterium SCGC AG-414-C22]
MNKTVTKINSDGAKSISSIKYLLEDAIKHTKSEPFETLSSDDQAAIFKDINTLNRTLQTTGTLEGSENMLDLSTQTTENDPTSVTDPSIHNDSDS